MGNQGYNTVPNVLEYIAVVARNLAQSLIIAGRVSYSLGTNSFGFEAPSELQCCIHIAKERTRTDHTTDPR